MLIKELKLKYNATQPISISEDNTNYLHVHFYQDEQLLANWLDYIKEAN